MENKAHLTAISRSVCSAPIRILDKLGLLSGKMLDYGCGRGKDAETFGMDKYDPHYQPEIPQGKYDVVTCSYVLNVIESDKERNECLERIKALLVKGGTAYITVRRDIKKEGYTSKGTHQTNVILSLPTVKKTSSFEIYYLTK